MSIEPYEESECDPPDDNFSVILASENNDLEISEDLINSIIQEREKNNINIRTSVEHIIDEPYLEENGLCRFLDSHITMEDFFHPNFGVGVIMPMLLRKDVFPYFLEQEVGEEIYFEWIGLDETGCIPIKPGEEESVFKIRYHDKMYLGGLQYSEDEKFVRVGIFGEEAIEASLPIIICKPFYELYIERIVEEQALEELRKIQEIRARQLEAEEHFWEIPRIDPIGDIIEIEEEPPNDVEEVLTNKFIQWYDSTILPKEISRFKKEISRLLKIGFRDCSIVGIDSKFHCPTRYIEGTERCEYLKNDLCNLHESFYKKYWILMKYL